VLSVVSVCLKPETYHSKRSTLHARMRPLGEDHLKAKAFYNGFVTLCSPVAVFFNAEAD